MNEQMVDLKPMGELDAMRNRAETAEMDARLAGEEIERLTHQLAERDALKVALERVRDYESYAITVKPASHVELALQRIIQRMQVIAANALKGGPQ